MHREPEPPETRKILSPDISMFPEFRKRGKSVRETERSEQKHAGRISRDENRLSGNSTLGRKRF